MCKPADGATTAKTAPTETTVTKVATADDSNSLPTAIQALEKELARRLETGESVLWEVGKLGSYYPQWVFKTHSKKPIRWFVSDFIEYFTYSHWAVTAAFVIAVSCYEWSTLSPEFEVSQRMLFFAFGVTNWPFVEYFMHGWVFHAPTSNYYANTIHFMMHGQHHVCMSDSRRLVMPPHIGWGMGVPFKMLGWTMFGVDAGICWACGLALGFCGYDLCHHALHHTSFTFLRQLRIRHFMHHHGHPDKYFGVSHGFTDDLFNTSGALKSDKSNGGKAAKIPDLKNE